ncbi:type II secretion system protein [Meiothermus taiwanensis]|nr:type II secretion system protein [Meiothermus taiwanensis]
MKAHSQKGISLLELLIGLAVLGILLGVGLSR